MKKEYEIYCPGCGKAIKRNAVTCIYCGVQVGQEVKHKPGGKLEVLLHEYSAFQTRYRRVWDMRLTFGVGIATIAAIGLVYGLRVAKEVLVLLPIALTLGFIVAAILELVLRQTGLYLQHIENKVNKVVGPGLLQYYTKYLHTLGGMDHKVLGMIPKSMMSILYGIAMLFIVGLWIFIICLAMKYITCNLPNWEIPILTLYISGPVISAICLLLGFRFSDSKFNSIREEDYVWYPKKK